MNSTVIDTLSFANSLRKAGMEPHQAEVMSRAINDELTAGVATKRNLDDAVVELKGEIARLDSRFDTLEAGLGIKFEAVDSKFEALDSKFEALDSKFEAKFEALDSKFDSKFEALSDRMNTQGRYTFLVFALIIGLGLYNTVTLHLTRPAATPPPAPAQAADP